MYGVRGRERERVREAMSETRVTQYRIFARRTTPARGNACDFHVGRTDETAGGVNERSALLRVYIRGARAVIATRVFLSIR